MDVSDAKTATPPFRLSFSETGFTLLEVLIALGLLSVGLLGLAALQIQGLRCTHEATMYTQAVTLAVDMAEQLRTNLIDSPLNLCANCVSAGPTAQALEDWKLRIAQRLPEGDGEVTRNTASVAVSVRWNDHGDARQLTTRLTP